MNADSARLPSTVPPRLTPGQRLRFAALGLLNRRPLRPVYHWCEAFHPPPLVVSYSRSGLNWIRYCAEYLTGRPTPGFTRLVRGNSGYVFHRTHRMGLRTGANDWSNPWARYRRLLLLVRNYKECLIRHHIETGVFQKSASVEAFLTADCRQSPAWYIENIRDFDAFEGEKLCVYYEEILEHPRVELTKIFDLLDIPVAGREEFFDHLALHQERSVNRYELNQKSYTRGAADKLVFHSQSVTPDQRREFDECYRRHHPELFAKYLARYQE
jgi:hypothetical protein